MNGVIGFVCVFAGLIALVAFFLFRRERSSGGFSLRSESANRLRACDEAGLHTPAERDWFLVGWDDHFLHKAEVSRPVNAGVKLDAAYSKGFEARLAWSREFTSL